MRLDDGLVSSHHALFACEDGQWVLCDAGSMNGSLVNGCRASKQVLEEGDRIQFGNTHFTFTTSASQSSDEAEECVDLEGPDVVGLESLDATTMARTIGRGWDDRAPDLARRLQAGYQISQAAAATLDLAEILDRVLDVLLGIFAQADRAFAVLVDPATHEVVREVVKCRRPEVEDTASVPRSALNYALEKRGSVLCRDALEDDRFCEAPSIAGIRVRSMMTGPLLFRDEVHGVIHVDAIDTAEPFSQEDLELITVAAMEVAACVANAALHRQLLEAERMAAIGHTVAGLSHCIKNILQSVTGGAFVLEKGLAEEDVGRIAAGWRMVSCGVDFMRDLVWDLLTLSKPGEPDRQMVDLNALCREVCDVTVEQARAEGVSLTFQPDESLPGFPLDPKGLRRCVLNLVGNAVDACRENRGSVTVRTRATSDGAAFEVVDTGTGMEPETLGRLFTTFFSTKGSKGTGLGLAVTKKIIEAHGGCIRVRSVQKEGTTFSVELPLNLSTDKKE